MGSHSRNPVHTWNRAGKEQGRGRAGPFEHPGMKGSWRGLCRPGGFALVALPGQAGGCLDIVRQHGANSERAATKSSAPPQSARVMACKEDRIPARHSVWFRYRRCFGCKRRWALGRDASRTPTAWLAREDSKCAGRPARSSR